MPSPYARAVAPQPAKPVGTITRGTTNPNRLRRIDRWITTSCAPLLRGAADPLVVDLGFGASPVTTVELLTRLRRVRADVEVIGLEIDPERVRAAESFAVPGLSFGLGGFELGGFELGGVELGGPVARRPVVVRAANVLRQYDEGEVAPAWAAMTARLASGGVVVDATCDELGRRCAWLAVTGSPEPQAVSLTLSMLLSAIERPSDVAERLPKALIHRNVPGEPIHAWLGALDQAWVRAAAHSAYGPRQRFVAAVQAVRAAGWPVLGSSARWRLGEVTLRWPPPEPTP
jgi:hypothetical protein